jgi:hypothetical protein
LYSATHARTNSSGVSSSGVCDGSGGVLVEGDDEAGPVGCVVDDAPSLHAVSSDKNRATDAHASFRTKGPPETKEPRAREDPRADLGLVTEPFPSCGERSLEDHVREHEGAPRTGRTRQPRVQSGEWNVERLGKSDVPRVVRRHGSAQLPDSFSKRLERVQLHRQPEQVDHGDMGEDLGFGRVSESKPPKALADLGRHHVRS